MVDQSVRIGRALAPTIVVGSNNVPKRTKGVQMLENTRVSKSQANSNMHDVHRVLGHDDWHNLQTRDAVMASVQCMAFWSMGGSKEDPTKVYAPVRPKNVREAVTAIVDETTHSHSLVADRVNRAIGFIETMHKTTVPFRVKVVKDNGRVLAMLLQDTTKPQAKPVPKPIDFGSAPVKEKAAPKGWDQLLSWATSAR
jgi:hypothetical protein